MMEAWTDSRLDDLAETLRPLPREVARQTGALDRFAHELQSMQSEMRSMRTEMRTELQAVRADHSALQRQLAQIGWSISAALIVAVLALLIAVI